MSNLQSTHDFTSESVSEGHPDKVADQISDAILDACLKQDSKAHVACETAVGPNLVVNLGEITCKGWDKINPEKIARDVVRDIGYNRPEEAFSFDTFTYINALHGQSPDINQGVDRGSLEKQGAGDQGIMFGYATNETPEMMPSTLIFSHNLLRRCAQLRKSGEIPFLRPDAKAQVSIRYYYKRVTIVERHAETGWIFFRHGIDRYFLKVSAEQIDFILDEFMKRCPSSKFGVVKQW